MNGNHETTDEASLLSLLKRPFFAYKTCVYIEGLWAIRTGGNTLQQKNFVPKS